MTDLSPEIVFNPDASGKSQQHSNSVFASANDDFVVEDEYWKLIARMTPAEKVERSIRMLIWARQMAARKLLAERPDLTTEELKWEIALQHYGDNPILREIIERNLSRVRS